jgi:hypothetical protein
LRTAVQIEQLASLSRLRRARKVLDRLRPLIAEAQGPLGPEEIGARMPELAGVAAADPIASQSVVEDPNAPPQIIS